jgi:chromosome segregation ATPase
MPPNYDPNSDDYHYPPRHEPAPDAEIERLRADLADKKKWISDLEREYGLTTRDLRAELAQAKARIAELNRDIAAKAHNLTYLNARAERAEAERDAMKEAAEKAIELLCSDCGPQAVTVLDEAR